MTAAQLSIAFFLQMAAIIATCRLVGWLARLADQHGVAVESAEIEGGSEPGMVNAGLVLRAR